jgi:glycosyltransferase involved in cell wall biosynthesis
VTRRALTIGIDARKIRDFGIGRYLEGLISGFAELGGPERFVLFVRDPDPADLPSALRDLAASGRFRLVPCPAGLYSPGELTAFRNVGTRHGLDVVHFPHYVRPLGPGCPVVVTIHDAIHLSHPPVRRRRLVRLYARIMMTWAVRSSAVVFADTDAARADITARLGVPADRFRVVPLAAGPGFRPPPAGEVDELRRRLDLPERAVVVIASHRPHKNLAAAIEAGRRAGLSPDSLLVTARDESAARAVRPIVGDRGRVLCPVPDFDLPGLFGAARVVLVPSLAEGFGLPGLEAAACGAAVLATPIAPHREVLGDAAAYAASGSAADLASALESLWSDDERIRALREAGPRRASRFSWRETARGALAGYREAASGFRSPPDSASLL